MQPNLAHQSQPGECQSHFVVIQREMQTQKVVSAPWPTQTRLATKGDYNPVAEPVTFQGKNMVRQLRRLQSLKRRLCQCQQYNIIWHRTLPEEDSAPRVRRLHLMVVDLHRRRRMADRVLRLLVDIQVDRCADECWNTLPIPWKQNQEAYQLRYVFGYAMDGSDLPCYILWPTRTAEQSFWCIDA